MAALFIGLEAVLCLASVITTFPPPSAAFGSSSPVVPALVAFGDSIMDTGNNNVLPTTLKCNFPPYGVDLATHQPTGRFSNGRIPSDFLASKLGIKEYLPPYLGSNLEAEDILTGVSFASGGTGYDPLTSRTASVLSMQDQLDLFMEYKEKVKEIAGGVRAATILSESLYLVCAGSDDIANTYFSTLLLRRRSEYDLPSYVNLMADSATEFVEQLINMGARKIGFVGLPPVGCLPSQRTNGGGIMRQCEPSRNEAALLFNSQMSASLRSLQTRTSGTNIIFLDIYSILLDFIQRPTAHGFTEVARGCCGTGEVEVSFYCNRYTPVTCFDDTKYLFWDSYHPTERTYQVLVDELVERYLRFL